MPTFSRTLITSLFLFFFTCYFQYVQCAHFICQFTTFTTLSGNSLLVLLKMYLFDRSLGCSVTEGQSFSGCQTPFILYSLLMYDTFCIDHYSLFICMYIMIVQVQCVWMEIKQTNKQRTQHKCLDRDLNPHSADQKYQNLNH